MPVWLIGMMGTGKTTAGKLAAETAGLPFLDSDALVEARLGVTIPEIWARYGEPGFRAEEKRVVHWISGQEGMAATGGGAVLDPESKALIATDPIVIWLRASVETLRGRIGNLDGRPLLDEGGQGAESLRELSQRRDPIYRDLASHQIDTDYLDAPGVAARIVQIWRGRP